MPANYMDQIPIRDDKHPWRMTDDGMAEVDMEHNGFYDRIAQKIFKKPRVSHRRVRHRRMEKYERRKHGRGYRADHGRSVPG